MNIRYLEILEAIAQAGTFTGAAKSLFITQSAVSHAVAELEEQAGTALFERLPRGVVLTACGSALLEESRNILAACRDLDRRIAHLEEQTPIHVVSSITIASFLLPQIGKHVSRQFPDLQISVQVMRANAALECLKRGDADLAFWEGAAPNGDFCGISLGAYSLRAACTPDFLTGKKALTLKELCQYPLLLREPGSAIRDTLDHVLALANQKAAPAWESVNSLALVKAAEAGLGITVLPERLLLDSVHLGRLQFLNLNAPAMENQMMALLRKDQYVAGPLRKLLECLFL